jgi:hypothetical protein
MRNTVVLAALTLLALVMALAAPAAAQPGFPASFYGAVAVDGQLVPDGTEVRGFIDGLDCTQAEPYRTTITENGVSQYAIEVVHESQMAGCGDEGRTVSFTVGGQPARETAEWKPGVTPINLNVGVGTGPTLPPATATPTLDPAEAAQTATEVARFTPILGTPPTDEVSPPGISTRDPSSTPAPPAAGDDGEDGGGGFLVLGAILVAILVLGAVGGTVLARRNRSNVSDP